MQSHVVTNNNRVETIQGPERSRIELVSRIPLEPVTDTAVLVIHGQWCNANTSIPFLDKNQKNGIASFSMSVRGYGASSSSGPLGASFQSAEQDILAAIKHLKKLGYKKIALVAHSSGGLIAARTVANNSIPEVTHLVLANSIPPAGSMSANTNYFKVLGAQALRPYLDPKVRLPNDLAELILFNNSGIPEGFTSDVGSHLINLAAITGLSTEQQQSIKKKHSSILVLASDKDRLFPNNKTEFQGLGVTEDQVVMLNGDHMAIFTNQAEVASQAILRHILTTEKK